ncbi:MAG: hypothetical protein F4Y05_00125 [Acidimicrobiaceae bacterium]|nr:hypothetical protein [Acidimicrobiaceae bacterium]MYI35758.1 hypothetical protein [Acidimicrobiaceae bacterium]
MADKSALYGNATMSAIWQRTLAALKRAERLVLFGYSVPQTDTSILALLATGTSPDTRVTIVDPHPDSIASRLAALRLLDTHAIDPPNGDSPYEWAHSL